MFHTVKKKAALLKCFLTSFRITRLMRFFLCVTAKEILRNWNVRLDTLSSFQCFIQPTLKNMQDKSKARLEETTRRVLILRQSSGLNSGKRGLWQEQTVVSCTECACV